MSTEPVRDPQRYRFDLVGTWRAGVYAQLSIMGARRVCVWGENLIGWELKVRGCGFVWWVSQCTTRVYWAASGGNRATLVGESMMQAIIQNRGSFRWASKCLGVGFLGWASGGPAVKNFMRDISPIQSRRVEAPMIINFESLKVRTLDARSMFRQKLSYPTGRALKQDLTSGQYFSGRQYNVNGVITC